MWLHAEVYNKGVARLFQTVLLNVKMKKVVLLLLGVFLLSTQYVKCEDDAEEASDGEFDGTSIFITCPCIDRVKVVNYIQWAETARVASHSGPVFIFL